MSIKNQKFSLIRGGVIYLQQGFLGHLESETDGVFSLFRSQNLQWSLDLTMYGYGISNEVSPKVVSTSVQKN